MKDSCFGGSSESGYGCGCELLNGRTPVHGRRDDEGRSSYRRRILDDMMGSKVLMALRHARTLKQARVDLY